MIMRDSRQNLRALLLLFCILPAMTNAWRLFWAGDGAETETATAAAATATATAAMVVIAQGEGTDDSNCKSNTALPQHQQKQTDFYDDAILSHEKMILDHGLHILYNLEERTQDCFKQAAARLREGCRSLLVSNHDKMAYALELTLCEVATAKIAIPTVCAQFTELDKHERPSDYNNIVQQCITLLAAVPQTWTSYSGYYRDAEAMCLAVRYPIERERLEQLHQNVTRYQIKQLSMLQQQQKYMAAWRHEEGTRLTQLRTLQDRLWQHMQRSFEDANQQQSEHLEALSTAIVKLKEESEAALLTNQHQWELYTQAGQQHWNSLWDFAYETLTKGIDQLDTRLREVLNASDKLLMQQYEAEAGWETIKDAQTRVVHDWDQTWTHVNTSLITMLQITAQEIQQLQLQVHDVREQIFTLVQSVQRASRRLMSIMSLTKMRVFGVLSCVMLLLVRWPRHLLWWSGSSVWVMCHRCPRLGSALGVIALLLILPILVTAMDAERELEWTMGIYCCVLFFSCGALCLYFYPFSVTRSQPGSIARHLPIHARATSTAPTACDSGPVCRSPPINQDRRLNQFYDLICQDV